MYITVSKCCARRCCRACASALPPPPSSSWLCLSRVAKPVSGSDAITAAGWAAGPGLEAEESGTLAPSPSTPPPTVPSAATGTAVAPSGARSGRRSCSPPAVGWGKTEPPSVVQEFPILRLGCPADGSPRVGERLRLVPLFPLTLAVGGRGHDREKEGADNHCRIGFCVLEKRRNERNMYNKGRNMKRITRAVVYLFSRGFV